MYYRYYYLYYAFEFMFLCGIYLGKVSFTQLVLKYVYQGVFVK